MNQQPIKDFYTYTLIVQQYYHLLHRYANKMIPLQADVDLLLAEIFCNLWKDKIRLVTGEDVRVYLKKNTKQLCMNWLHSNAIRLKTFNNQNQ